MKRGRPREPKPILRGRIYWARVTFDAEGVSVRRWVNLKTSDLAVAKVKLAHVVKRATAPERAAEAVEVGESFEDAARRIVGESTIGTKATRLGRLALHVFPTIGAKPVKDIRAGDVRTVVEDFVKRGASKQSCIHLRNDISAVLGALWRTDMLPENVTAKVQIPKAAKVDRRERTVLEDHELGAYLAWTSPVKREREPVLERQVMACVARIFGGPRWGDLRAWDWSFFDTSDGAFTVGWVPRKKTERPQAIEVPEMLRPVLRTWWEVQGRPSAGPVFPVRRGGRAGEERKGGSMAKALRRDLVRAFGIERAEPVQVTRSNGRPDTKWKWRPARPMSPRETELLTETKFTRPVDFHSFRRRFKQALAENKVDVQEAMRLSGASSVQTHMGYLRNTTKAAEIPVSTLPNSVPDFRSKLAFPAVREGLRGLLANAKDPESAAADSVTATYKPVVAGSIPVPPTKNLVSSWLNRLCVASDPAQGLTVPMKQMPSWLLLKTFSPSFEMKTLRTNPSSS
jgi:integrase